MLSLSSRWLEEIDRKQAEMVAAQISLEKLRQRDQLLKTENEMLKVEKFVFWGKISPCTKYFFFFFPFWFLALLPFICVDGECKS